MKSFLPKLTFWRIVAAVAIACGLYATVVRFTQGLGASTNLSDDFPWGLWIGFDVLVGVGLAAGGFTITAAVHIFDLKSFRPVVRPAILTAFLGYLLVAMGLLFDIGRPLRLWHPIIMWNPHSVMFEVAWCVTLYMTVLALEFSPLLLERLKLKALLRIVRSVTPVVVIAGVLLSTLHQSSLGTLYLIVPQKLHGLWYSSLLPVLFFLSAIAAGLSMVILESFMSSRAFGRRLEMHLLQDLARAVVVVLALYLVVRLQDLAGRGGSRLLTDFGPEQFLFLVEIVFGAIVPILLLSVPSIRRDRTGLFCSALLVVLGFVLNRMNVSITGMQRSMGASYFPSFLELAVTAMLVTFGFVGFALAVKYLKVFPEGSQPEPLAAGPGRSVAGFLGRGAVVGLAIVMVLGACTLDFGMAATPEAGPAEDSQSGDAVVPDGGELALPKDLKIAGTGDSPGPVTFSHEDHIDPDKPDCAGCHRSAYPILRAEPGSVRPPIGKRMHGKEHCGRCHNGRIVFSVNDEDCCEDCHEED